MKLIISIIKKFKMWISFSTEDGEFYITTENDEPIICEEERA
jgi:hypothetical protein